MRLLSWICAGAFLVASAGVAVACPYMQTAQPPSTVASADDKLPQTVPAETRTDSRS